MEHIGKLLLRKKKYKKEFHREKWKKLKATIATATNEIPKAKTRATTKKSKPLINTALPDMDCEQWKYWVKRRKDIIKETRGLELY